MGGLAGGDPLSIPLRVTFDSTGRLASDVICVFCGHNLRGLLPTGLCGECGQSVERSMRGGALANADPQWVDRLRGGTALLALALPWLWLPLAWPVVWYAGWRMTSPNPAAPAGGGFARFGLRAMLVVLAAITPTFGFIPAGTGKSAEEVAPPVIAAYAGAWLLWSVLAVSHLSDRVENGRLHRLMRLTLWACVIALGLSAVVMGGYWLPLVLTGSMGSPSVPDIAILLVVIPLGLAGLIVAPVGVFWLWRELEVAETLARGGRVRIRMWAPAAAGAASAATRTGAKDPAPPAQV